jgi:hypothetical protein
VVPPTALAIRVPFRITSVELLPAHVSVMVVIPFDLPDFETSNEMVVGGGGSSAGGGGAVSDGVNNE